MAKTAEINIQVKETGIEKVSELQKKIDELGASIRKNLEEGKFFEFAKTFEKISDSVESIKALLQTTIKGIADQFVVIAESAFSRAGSSSEKAVEKTSARITLLVVGTFAGLFSLPGLMLEKFLSGSFFDKFLKRFSGVFGEIRSKAITTFKNVSDAFLPVGKIISGDLGAIISLSERLSLLYSISGTFFVNLAKGSLLFFGIRFVLGEIFHLGGAIIGSGQQALTPLQRISRIIEFADKGISHIFFTLHKGIAIAVLGIGAIISPGFRLLAFFPAINGVIGTVTILFTRLVNYIGKKFGLARSNFLLMIHDLRNLGNVGIGPITKMSKATGEMQERANRAQKSLKKIGEAGSSPAAKAVSQLKLPLAEQLQGMQLKFTVLFEKVVREVTKITMLVVEGFKIPEQKVTTIGIKSERVMTHVKEDVTKVSSDFEKIGVRASWLLAIFKKIGSYIAKFLSIPMFFVSGISIVLGLLIKGIALVLGLVVKGIAIVLSGIATIVKGAVSGIAFILSGIAMIVKGAVSGIAFILSGAIGLVKAVLPSILSHLSSAYDFLSRIEYVIWSGIIAGVNALKSAWPIIKKYAMETLGILWKMASSLWDMAKGAASFLGSLAKSAVSSLWNVAKGAVSSFVGGISSRRNQKAEAQKTTDFAQLQEKKKVVLSIDPSVELDPLRKKFEEVNKALLKLAEEVSGKSAIAKNKLAEATLAESTKSQDATKKRKEAIAAELEEIEVVKKLQVALQTLMAIQDRLAWGVSKEIARIREELSSYQKALSKTKLKDSDKGSTEQRVSSKIKLNEAIAAEAKIAVGVAKTIVELVVQTDVRKKLAQANIVYAGTTKKVVQEDIAATEVTKKATQAEIAATEVTKKATQAEIAETEVTKKAAQEDIAETTVAAKLASQLKSTPAATQIATDAMKKYREEIARVLNFQELLGKKFAQGKTILFPKLSFTASQASNIGAFISSLKANIERGFSDARLEKITARFLKSMFQYTGPVAPNREMASQVAKIIQSSMEVAGKEGISSKTAGVLNVGRTIMKMFTAAIRPEASEELRESAKRMMSTLQRYTTASISGGNFSKSGTEMMRQLAAGIKTGAAKPIEEAKKSNEQLMQNYPMSPAKEGPLRNLVSSGSKIPFYIAQGMRSGGGLLSRAAGFLAETVANFFPRSLPGIGALKAILSMGFKIPFYLAQGILQGKNAIVGAAQSIASYFQQTLDETLGMGKLASQTGISVEKISVLDFALQHLGASSGETAFVFTKIQENLRKTLTEDELFKFKMLGINLDEVRNSGEPALDMFYQLADVLKTSQVGSEKYRAALELLGTSSSSTLVVALKNGSITIKEFAAEVAKLGGVGSVVSKESVEAAKSLHQLERSFSMIKGSFLREIMTEVAPNLKKSFDMISTEFAASRKNVLSYISVLSSAISLVIKSITAIVIAFIKKPDEAFEAIKAFSFSALGFLVDFGKRMFVFISGPLFKGLSAIFEAVLGFIGSVIVEIWTAISKKFSIYSKLALNSFSIWWFQLIPNLFKKLEILGIRLGKWLVEVFPIFTIFLVKLSIVVIANAKSIGTVALKEFIGVLLSGLVGLFEKIAETNIGILLDNMGFSAQDAADGLKLLQKAVAVNPKELNEANEAIKKMGDEIVEVLAKIMPFQSADVVSSLKKTRVELLKELEGTTVDTKKILDNLAGDAKAKFEEVKKSFADLTKAGGELTQGMVEDAKKNFADMSDVIKKLGLQEIQKEWETFLAEFNAKVVSANQKITERNEAAAEAVTDPKKAAAKAIQDQITKDEEAAEKARNKRSLEWMNQSLSDGEQFFSDLGSMSKKKRQEIMIAEKAFAIARAVMDGAQTIMKVLADPVLPFPLAIASIPLVLAIQAMQIAKISGVKFAKGGNVDGPSGADVVPAWLTAGEFVIPRPSVEFYGKGFLEGIRSRLVPRQDLPDTFYTVSSMRKHRYQTGGVVAAPNIAATATSAQQVETPDIVNILDPNLFDRYVASNRGRKAILNIISEYGI